MTQIASTQCKKCKSEFDDYISNNRKYCSKECAYSDYVVNHEHICQECKNSFTTKKRVSKFCSLRCSGINANRFIVNHRGGAGTGKNHWNWKGGKSYTGMYKTIRINGKSVLEHRFVVESYLGRKLTSREQVHHINMKHKDNRIENLIVVTPEWHTKLHHLLRRKTHGNA